MARFPRLPTPPGPGSHPSARTSAAMARSTPLFDPSCSPACGRARCRARRLGPAGSPSWPRARPGRLLMRSRVSSSRATSLSFASTASVSSRHRSSGCLPRDLGLPHHSPLPNADEEQVGTAPEPPDPGRAGQRPLRRGISAGSGPRVGSVPRPVARLEYVAWATGDRHFLMLSFFWEIVVPSRMAGRRVNGVINLATLRPAPWPGVEATNRRRTGDDRAFRPLPFGWLGRTVDLGGVPRRRRLAPRGDALGGTYGAAAAVQGVRPQIPAGPVA